MIHAARSRCAVITCHASSSLLASHLSATVLRLGLASPRQSTSPWRRLHRHPAQRHRVARKLRSFNARQRRRHLSWSAASSVPMETLRQTLSLAPRQRHPLLMGLAPVLSDRHHRHLSPSFRSVSSATLVCWSPSPFSPFSPSLPLWSSETATYLSQTSASTAA